MSNETDTSLQEATKVRLLVRNTSTILYHGSLRESEREVAIKVWLMPPRTPSQSQQAFALLRQEIETLQQLKHPHIVQLLNIRRTAQGFVIVSDYAQRGSLQQVLQSHPLMALPLERALDIVQQIGTAFVATHEQNIVHGNLTPNNVLFLQSKELDGQDLVVLSDFYLSALSVGQPRDNEHTQLRFYMAPESFQGTTSPQSDQYALACLAYEMLTGQTPFTGAARTTLYRRHSNEAVPPPSQLNGALSPAIDAALLKALAKQPAERYASVADFLAALGTDTAITANKTSMIINPPLLLEAEAISQAADELIKRDTAEHPVLVLPLTPTEGAPDNATAAAQAEEHTQAISAATASEASTTNLPNWQQARQAQSKRTRILLIAILLLAVLGSAFFAFFTHLSSSGQSAIIQSATGGNIVTTPATHTSQATATATAGLTATAAAAFVQKTLPTPTLTNTNLTPVPTKSVTPTSTPGNKPTPTATAGSTSQPGGANTVKPIFECVQSQGAFYLAKFGYLNNSSNTINIPQGTNNNINNSMYTPALPTTFSPGRQDHAFQIQALKGTTVAWNLDGSTATALATDQHC